MSTSTEDTACDASRAHPIVATAAIIGEQGDGTSLVLPAGETSVLRIHSGNSPHEEMDRWTIACFDEALQDVGCHGMGSGLARTARLACNTRTRRRLTRR